MGYASPDGRGARDRPRPPAGGGPGGAPATAEDLGAELQAEGHGWSCTSPCWRASAAVRQRSRGIRPAAGGSRLVFRPETSVYHVQTAGGDDPPPRQPRAACSPSLWPFFPRLLQLAPFGAVIALGGWFLVISRLRTSGPDEFLAMRAVEARMLGPEDPPVRAVTDGRRTAVGMPAAPVLVYTQAADGSLETWGCTGFDGEQSGAGAACRASARNTGKITANDNFALAA